MTFDLARRRAAELDSADPLARWREEFRRPAGQIYLDGNSLGLLSHRAEASLLRAVAAWGAGGINGWLEGSPPWISMATQAAEHLAALVGAQPCEVAATGQTTTNLHQLLATLFEPGHPTRRTMVGDVLNFASDTYALQSHLQMRGLNPKAHLRLIPSSNGLTLEREEIVRAMSDDVQILVLPSVLYTSGQALDVAGLTREAHQRGILIGWDLAHGIGAVPYQLGGYNGPDFAFWCNYKWLNAGPGAIGGLFLHQRHHHRRPGLAGWWGARPDRRFAMDREHQPATGAEALHIGTPPILSLAPLLGSLEIFVEVGGVEPLRQKSLQQTALLIELAASALAPWGFALATPSAADERGGHIALTHPEAWRVCQALKAVGVTPDFRSPNLMRLAPSPLYTSFSEVVEAAARLQQIAQTKAYEAFPAERPLVP
jgi:kynureninase